ncbi:MAG TPA: type II toxin-antitoxin system RelE/ParE family toxin [Planctomycetaceae bacterium]
MARTIAWTGPALRDVDGIAAYIHRDSPQYAASFVARLFRAAEGIRFFPEAGALVPEYDRDDLREIFVGNYRLIYQVTDDEVIVHAVIHGARDLRRAWRPDRD